MVENEVYIFFPIEPQVGSRATPATIGGSLKNLLAAARQKPAEPKAEELEANRTSRFQSHEIRHPGDHDRCQPLVGQGHG